MKSAAQGKRLCIEFSSDSLVRLLDPFSRVAALD